MPFKVVKPNNTAGGKCKRRGLIGHTLAIARDEMAEGNAIVEGTHFQGVIRPACRMREGDPHAVIVVHRLRMNAARWVLFFEGVKLHLARLDVATEVNAVDHDTHLGSIDDDAV